MNVTPQFLLEGAYYALVQCGKLLTSAVALFNAGDYATAVAVATFAHEELGRFRYLKTQRTKLIRGENVSIKTIRETCENHEAKQKWGQVSVVHKLSRKLFGILKHPRSQEFQEAEQELRRLTSKIRGRAPRERHKDRMSSLYVEPTRNEKDWNKPWEKNCEDARRTIEITITDYRLGAKLFDLDVRNNTDPELTQAVKRWESRLPIPPVPRLSDGFH